MIRKKEGFTLVELLIVIAIIIILAAILYPVFARAREKAHQTRCLNNIKQFAAAIEMYEDDYEGTIMPWATGGPAGNYTWGYFWQDMLDPYIKQLKKGATGGTYFGQGELLTCPSAVLEVAEGAPTWQIGKTYGYNHYLGKPLPSGPVVPRSVAEVKYPAVTLRITECSTQNPDDPNSKYLGGSWFAPVPNPAAAGYGFPVYAPGWHGGMNNVLWVDGHVTTITRQRVMLTDNNPDPNVWCRLSPKPGYTAE